MILIQVEPLTPKAITCISGIGIITIVGTGAGYPPVVDRDSRIYIPYIA